MDQEIRTEGDDSVSDSKGVVLETRHLTKKFGGLIAVNDVSVRIEKRACWGLIGPNGAGKSTFFNLVCGILKPTSGQVILEGEDVTGWPPYRVSKRGLGRSFQVTNIFTRLPVMENVRIAVQSRGKDNYNFHSDADNLGQYKRKTLEILEMVGLKGKAFYLADFLTHGDQRKLEIAMALATEPRILLLDEPTAGVSIEEVPSLTSVIRKIKQAQQMTILLVEHKIDVIMDICDSVFVMHEGAKIAEGTTREITDNQLVQTVYLGGD
jgi:branched-chain amino acid transport system ATP-binding protein